MSYKMNEEAKRRSICRNNFISIKSWLRRREKLWKSGSGVMYKEERERGKKCSRKHLSCDKPIFAALPRKMKMLLCVCVHTHIHVECEWMDRFVFFSLLLLLLLFSWLFCLRCRLSSCIFFYRSLFLLLRFGVAITVLLLAGYSFISHTIWRWVYGSGKHCISNSLWSVREFVVA